MLKLALTNTEQKDKEESGRYLQLHHINFTWAISNQNRSYETQFKWYKTYRTRTGKKVEPGFPLLVCSKKELQSALGAKHP